MQARTGPVMKIKKLPIPDGSGRCWNSAFVLSMGDEHEVLLSYGEPLALWDGMTLFSAAGVRGSATAERQGNGFREWLLKARGKVTVLERSVTENDLNVLIKRCFLAPRSG